MEQIRIWKTSEEPDPNPINSDDDNDGIRTDLDAPCTDQTMCYSAKVVEGLVQAVEATVAVSENDNVVASSWKPRQARMRGSSAVREKNEFLDWVLSE